MKVGLLIYGSLDTVSGGYFYNRQLVRYLRERGDEVSVVSWPFRGYWRHLTDNLRLRLLAQLRALDVDVLIQDEMNHPSLVLLNMVLRKQVSYPIVSLVHLLRITDDSHSQNILLTHHIEKRYLASVDGLICTSETTRRDIVQHFGLEKPSIVAYPGADRFALISRCASQSRSLKKRLRIAATSELRLLYVGNVIRRKGLHQILHALAKVDDVELWVVGSLSAENSYTTHIDQLINRYSLHHRVHFLGTLASEQLADQYARSDVFVMPSSYESFGIVYLEALQFGLPVIAGNQGAAFELVTHGKNGYLVHPQAANSLAMYIRLLRDDPAQRDRLSKAAAESVVGQPDWQTSMASLRQFLIQLL